MITLNANDPNSKRVYKGDPNCPRTVVIQIDQIPGIGPVHLIEAVWFSSDKPRLDNAAQMEWSNSTFVFDGSLTGLITEGIALGQTLNKFNGNFKNVFTMVLPGVRSDIYARATYFDTTNQIPESGTFNIWCEAF